MKKVAIYINVTWNPSVIQPLKKYFTEKNNGYYDFFGVNNLVPNFSISNLPVFNNTSVDMMDDIDIVFLSLTDYNHYKNRFKNNNL